MEDLINRNAHLVERIRKYEFASAEKYGHTVSQFCINNPGFMHAEVGALIAEHEFGLKDRDALNAIKYHPTGRPDMSMLEEISSFLDDMESHYGSSGESIMKAIGLGEQELKALRDKYLE